jgi:hypothetical protein
MVRDAGFEPGTRHRSGTESRSTFSRGKFDLYPHISGRLRQGSRFNDAIGTAQIGLQLAHAQADSSLANEIEKDVDPYRANIPLRDSSLTNAQPAR